MAKAGLRALEAGAVSVDGLLRSEDRLADLLLLEGRALATRIAVAGLPRSSR